MCLMNEDQREQRTIVIPPLNYLVFFFFVVVVYILINKSQETRVNNKIYIKNIKQKEQVINFHIEAMENNTSSWRSQDTSYILLDDDDDDPEAEPWSNKTFDIEKNPPSPESNMFKTPGRIPTQPGDILLSALRNLHIASSKKKLGKSQIPISTPKFKRNILVDLKETLDGSKSTLEAVEKITPGKDQSLSDKQLDHLTLSSGLEKKGIIAGILEEKDDKQKHSTIPIIGIRKKRTEPAPFKIGKRINSSESVNSSQHSSKSSLSSLNQSSNVGKSKLKPSSTASRASTLPVQTKSMVKTIKNPKTDSNKEIKLNLMNRENKSPNIKVDVKKITSVNMGINLKKGISNVKRTVPVSPKLQTCQRVKSRQLNQREAKILEKHPKIGERKEIQPKSADPIKSTSIKSRAMTTAPKTISSLPKSFV